MINFDEKTNRFNVNSLKWNVNSNELPMWVADMDFRSPVEVEEALIKRVNQGCYGYNIIPDSWKDSIINWWSKRHNFKMKKDWLMFSTGVVPSISSIVRKLTSPAEKVVLLTPVYNIFFNSIYNNGRYIYECPLKYENYEYQIDFDILEEALSDPQTSMLIFCNPHNPIGKIWSFEELKKIGELCYKYNVLVVSDEIHCDITRPNLEYIPFQSVSKECRDNSIVCISPTKTFNIAGLQSSAISVVNPLIRHKVYRGINTDEIAEPNSFAITAVEAAYKCEYWVDELREYIYENRRIFKKYLEKELPMIHLIEGDATYLLWVDIKNITNDSKEFCNFLRKETGLYITPGDEYGKSGRGFVRINIATQRENIYDALTRLKNGINKFLNK